MGFECLRFDKLFRLPKRSGFVSIELNPKKDEEEDVLEIVIVQDNDAFVFYATPFTYTREDLEAFAAVFHSIAQHIELFAKYVEKARQHWEEEVAKYKTELTKSTTDG